MHVVMDKLLLVGSIALLIAAFRFHALAQVNVKSKIDKEWFDRLFTGSRAPRHNLTELGLRYRKQSNLYAIGGFIMIGVFIFSRTTN